MFYGLGERPSEGQSRSGDLLIEPYLRCCEKSPCDWKIRLHSANLPCELRLVVEKYEDHQRGVKTMS